MADLQFGIRITADGRASIGPLREVAGGVDEIGNAATRASGAVGVFKGAFAALQLDRVVRELFASARETMNFAARLDDLSDMTGSTVEDLSALANMAKFSGTQFGLVETALNQFTRRLSAADNESKRMGDGLRALGISARDPATAFREVAVELNKYEDGYRKAALVQEIFGRNGMQLLPLLKDLATQQEVGSRITTEQAKAAERLDREIVKLQASFSGLRDVLLSNVVPALSNMLEQFREGIRLAGGFGRALLDFGVGISPFRDIAENIAKVEKDLAAARERNLFGWNDKLIETYERQLAFLKLIQQQQRRTLDYADSEPGGSTARPRPDAPAVAGAGGSRGRSAAEREADRALRERQRLLAQDAAGWVRAIEEMERQWEAEAQAIIRGNEALEQERKRLMEQDARGWVAYIEALEAQWDAEAHAIARANDEAFKHGEALAEAQRRAAADAAEDARRQWENTAQSINDSLTDAVSDSLLVKGIDAGQRMRDALVDMFDGLVLRPIIQGVMAPIAGGITSMLSGGAAASGGGGFGGLLQAGGSLFGGGGGLGGLFGGVGSVGAFGPMIPTFGSSLLGGLASPLATAGGLFSGGAGAFGGGMAALGAGLGAAIPIIGFGLAIASALGAFDRGGPKTGGHASNIPGFVRTMTPSQGDPQMRELVRSTTDAFAQSLRQMGGTGIGRFQYEFDTDPEGDAQARIGATAVVDGRRVYGFRDREVGGDIEDVQRELAVEARRVLLAALQASDLPSSIAALLNTVTASAASEEEINNLIAFASAMGDVVRAIDGSVAEDAADAWEEANATIAERLRTMGAEVAQLAAEQDGTTESMQRLATATGEYRQAVVSALVAVEQVAAQLNETFAATRETLEFGGLSDQQTYDLYRSKTDTLFAALQTADSPETVSALSEQINRYFLSAFNLLSPEEMIEEKPEFLAGLDALEAAVSERLRTIAGNIEAETVEPFAAANAALDAAATKYGAAGEAFTTASGTFAAAVDRFDATTTRLESTIANLSIIPQVSLTGSEVGA